ncbi:MAG: flagellar hook-length control protein FliK [Perlucidibaca sp.]
MRILPPLPASAQLTPASLPGQTTGSRLVAAEVLASLGDDLYQVVAGRLTLDVRSTLPLQPGQQVQLQLPRQDVPAAQAPSLPGPGTPASASPSAGTPGTPSNGMPGSLAQPLSVASQISSQANQSLNTTLFRQGPERPASIPAAPVQAPLVTLATTPGIQSRQTIWLSAIMPAGPRQTQDQQAELNTGSGAEEVAMPSEATATQRSRSPAPPPQADPRQALVRSQIQNLVPHQQDPTRLVALLRALQPALAQPAASALTQAAARLLASVPELASLDGPESVRQLLQTSGLLSESAATTSAPAQDLKQALLAVRAAAPDQLPPPVARISQPAGHLQPLATAGDRVLTGPGDPGGDHNALLLQLAAEVGPVLARLETHQLMHLQQPDPRLQHWLFELPLRQGQDISLWQLHLEKDGRRAHGSDAASATLWSVTLSVDFPETGPLMIRLGLHDGQLHAHFHAEAATTAEQLGQQLPALRERLEARGIHEPLLTSQRGLPHRDSLPQMPRTTLEISA